ncbi:MAG: response regulator [Planctomycetes bacterium]|nr:response regulator [Planctomycetota bacterium]
MTNSTHPMARLLVVDDSPTVRTALQRLFTENGYEVALCGSGREALTQLRTQPTDVVILDLVMDDMRGEQVLREMKAEPKLADIPVLLLTAVSDRAELVACLDLGADDFIVKPWDRRELLGRLRAMVRLKRALDAARTSAARSQALLNALAQVALLIDETGCVLSGNQRAAELFGKCLAELHGRQLAEFLPPSRREQWPPRIEQVLTTGTPQRFEETHQDRVFDTCLYPVKEDGRVTGCAIVSDEITQRKKAERELAELNRRMIDASRQAGIAEIATDVLHNVGNALSRINVASGMVHDQLRTLGIDDFRRAAELIEKHRDHLAEYCTQDERGQHLPNFLIELSQHMAEQEQAILGELRDLQEGVQRVNEIVAAQQAHAGNSCMMEEVRFEDLIEEAIRNHQQRIDQSGIQVECNCEPLPPARADRRKVLQILTELLGNAVDALSSDDGDRPKRIKIRLFRDDRDQVCIEIRDNGVGIAPENLSRVFSQSYTTKENAQGLGLHDAVLRAKEHGGELVAESDGVGKGAAFTLRLPFKPADESAPSIQ